MDDVDACAALVRARGGVIRQADAIAAGATKRALAECVRRGTLQRVRRSWLVLPDADSLLVAAARAGVILSCVTRAKRLGLWVLEDGRPHVAAPSTSGGVCVRETRSPSGGTLPRAVVHWSAPIVPRPPHTLEDSVENTLVLVAMCRPRESALAVWESALRTGMADRQALGRLPLPVRARELLEVATDYSDSGLETLVLLRLRWLRVRIIPQAWILGHRTDFLIGERLVLQIDGGHHVGRHREEDIAHDAELLLRGYHVIRVGYRQVMEDWPAVQDRIMRAIAQGLHRA